MKRLKCKFDNLSYRLPSIQKKLIYTEAAVSSDETAASRHARTDLMKNGQPLQLFDFIRRKPCAFQYDFDGKSGLFHLCGGFCTALLTTGGRYLPQVLQKIRFRSLQQYFFRRVLLVSYTQYPAIYFGILTMSGVISASVAAPHISMVSFSSPPIFSIYAATPASAPP